MNQQNHNFDEFILSRGYAAITPAIVLMAAGMGSRYGGLKQIEPIGPFGETIMDYSIYDALKAGFGKVVFVIKKDNEKEFREAIGRRIENVVDTEYVFQRIDDLPHGFAAPPDRKKPWGTGHAVLSCRNAVKEPFAIINTDDFYGSASFKLMGDFLKTAYDTNGVGHYGYGVACGVASNVGACGVAVSDACVGVSNVGACGVASNVGACGVASNVGDVTYALTGFRLGNTLSRYGQVSRAVCVIDANGFLMDIKEYEKISRIDGRISAGALNTETGSDLVELTDDMVVSMNMWGFRPSIFGMFETAFIDFMHKRKEQLANAELYLPYVVQDIIHQKKARVKVIISGEQWHGVTYREDRDAVVQAVKAMIGRGFYPECLWHSLV